MDGQTFLTNTTKYVVSAVATGTNKETKKIKVIMKQLASSVTAQATIVATLFTKTNKGGSSSRITTDKNKARHGLHV